eukprot:m.465685 g.465685  ORF g.465685 m.465685 type:complete len:92 (+) comp20361_c14_seq20:1732-2007(+)
MALVICVLMKLEVDKWGLGAWVLGCRWSVVVSCQLTKVNKKERKQKQKQQRRQQHQQEQLKQQSTRTRNSKNLWAQVEDVCRVRLQVGPVW